MVLKSYLSGCYSMIQQLKIDSNFIKQLSRDFEIFTCGWGNAKNIFKYYSKFANKDM